MTDAELELARRLVASPRWRWMRGMICDFGSFVCGDDEYYIFTDSGPKEKEKTSRVPDLSEPATQGCLAAMLREAHDLVSLEWEWEGEEENILFVLWYRAPRGTEYHNGKTYGEALARALLAAWGSG